MSSDAHTIVPGALDSSDAGVALVEGRELIVGTHRADWKSIRQLMDLEPREHPGGSRKRWFGIGIHPWFVRSESDPDEDINVLREMLIAEPQLRIGEIGLDKSGKHKSTFQQQVAVFQRQLLLACELRRSVSIHCVRSHGTLLEILRKLDGDAEIKTLPKGIYLHSWSGSADVTRDILRLERVGPTVYFGVSMKINANRPEAVMDSGIPRDRVLAESDLSLDDPNRIEAIKQAESFLVKNGVVPTVKDLHANFEKFVSLMSEEG